MACPTAKFAALDTGMKILILAVIPAAAYLAYWPLRLAWADHLSRAADAETVARAVRLSPGDADFRLKLAAAQQAAGADPTAALEAAAALDPGNADALARLGVAAEMRGDLRVAESRLLGRPRQPAVRAALGACQLLLPPRRPSAFLAVGRERPC
jgi:thioredoxin-like negative regulator of GroEL